MSCLCRPRMQDVTVTCTLTTSLIIMLSNIMRPPFFFPFCSLCCNAKVVVSTYVYRGVLFGTG